LEKVKHPALEMVDMADYATGGESENVPEPAAGETVDNKTPEPATTAAESAALSEKDVAGLKEQLTNEIRETVTKDIVSTIINVLSREFLGLSAPDTPEQKTAEQRGAIEKPDEKPKAYISAASRIGNIKSFAVPKEKWENSVWTVKLGNLKSEGGTRGKTYTVGGATAMPFHLWEGEMPNRPLVAMEVFDRVSEKYPQILREIYGSALNDPAAMAKICVEKYGADLISVRLDGTHPERGDRSASDAADIVERVLKAVEVPLIITGHSHYEKNNEVMKTIAQRFEGENLLFNWVEQDNYRTIAGAAIAYGHCVVSQSPIDVNIGKQLNILLTNMDVKPEKIIMDPMTGAIGYGIEYTYSVMERIRLTGLGGDKMLCAPMIVSTGQECIKIKEWKAPEEAFPAWGDLAERAALWEMSTALTLLQAGADIIIMYHPDAVRSVKDSIYGLMDKAGGRA
jgi:acetyl-CoA decarbonylase/synthase complex subunit delta